MLHFALTIIFQKKLKSIYLIMNSDKIMQNSRHFDITCTLNVTWLDQQGQITVTFEFARNIGVQRIKYLYHPLI